MKKFGLLVLIGALILGIALANSISYGKINLRDFISFSSSVNGSGNVVSETRNLSEFTSVRVSGVFKVEIVAGSTQNVVIESEDNLLPYIETTVIDGTLTIRSSKKIKPTSSLKVVVSVNNIEQIRASGASTISLTNLNNASLVIDASGVSKTTVSGTTADLSIKVSGASNVNAEELVTQKAVVGTSGSSKVTVKTVENLKARSSGASSVLYKGSPANVDVKTSGASRIEELQ